jgi:hypothetical protein
MKINNLYFIRFLNKKNIDKLSVKIVRLSILFIVLLFWMFTIPILLIIYLGIIIYRRKYIKRLGNLIRKQFSYTFRKSYHKFKGILLMVVFILIFLIVVLMIFTIPILILIAIGYYIEKNHVEPKKDKSKTYVYNYIDTDKIDKKESKTIERL